jgi:hypothetical protein
MSREYLRSTKLEDMERPLADERFNANGEWDRVLPLLFKVELSRQ